MGRGPSAADAGWLWWSKKSRGFRAGLNPVFFSPCLPLVLSLLPSPSSHLLFFPWFERMEVIRLKRATVCRHTFIFSLLLFLILSWAPLTRLSTPSPSFTLFHGPDLLRNENPTTNRPIYGGGSSGGEVGGMEQWRAT